MKKSTRTFLFTSFVLLFLIITPLIIGYSQGYRVDWKDKTLVQTGALFFEPRPAPVKLFLDGELEKKSSFVFQNIFTGDLIPKTYHIEIKKEGYTSWEKNLDVAPKLVTEARYIVLFPEPGLREVFIIKDDIKNFTFSSSEKYLALVSKNVIPKISIYSTDSKKEILTFTAPKTFSGYAVGDIQWNKNSRYLLFSLEKGRIDRLIDDPLVRQKTWVSVDLTGDELMSIDISQEIIKLEDFKEHTRKLYSPAITQVSWSQNDSNKIFFVANDNSDDHLLFSYNLSSKKLSKPLAYDVLKYSVVGNKILYVSSVLHNVNSLNTDTGRIQQILFSPIFNIEGADSIAFLENLKNPYTALIVDESLYILDAKTASLKKISSPVSDAMATNDGKKIIIVDENIISVYWIEDIQIQPFRDAGDIKVIYTSSDKISDAVWFSQNNEYIIFSTADAIKAVELDTRDKVNTSTLFAKKASKIFYNGKNETLYFLSDETVYSLLIN